MELAPHCYCTLLQANDGANTDSLQVRVVVQDINDCDPDFVEDEYRFNINENLPRGSSVGSVRATDCDEGRNSVLRYTIAGGSVGVFQLDCKGEPLDDADIIIFHVVSVVSGVITILTALDFEQASSYTLTVIATDMGLPNPRSGI